MATKRDEEKIKKELLTFIDPQMVNSFVTPFVISVVSGILSTFLADFIKQAIRRKKVENELREKIYIKASQTASDFHMSKDLGLRIASYTIEYVETH